MDEWDLAKMEAEQQALAERIAQARSAEAPEPEPEEVVEVQVADDATKTGPTLVMPASIWKEIQGETAPAEATDGEARPAPPPPRRLLVGGGGVSRRGSFRRPPVLEPEEQAPEPRKPQPTCRFFAPNRATAAETGAEAGPDWPFDRLHPTAMGCCQPDLNAAGNTQCAFWEHQEECGYYEASAPVAFRRRRLTKPIGDEGESETVVLTLAGRRWEQGTPRYAILSGPEGEAPSVLAEITEPGADIRSRAEARYDQLQADFEPTETVELSVADKPVAPHSYLRSLVEA